MIRISTQSAKVAAWLRGGSISRRLVLALGLLCAISLLASNYIRDRDETRLRVVSESSNKDRILSIERELLRSIQERKSTLRLAGGELKRLPKDEDVDGVYTYTSDGKLLSRQTAAKSGLEGWDPLQSNRKTGAVGLKALTQRKNTFVRRGTGYIELVTTKIGGKTLVAASKVTQMRVKALERTTGTRIEFLSRAEHVRRNAVASVDRFEWYQELTNARGTVVAYRFFSSNSPVQAQFAISILRAQFFTTVLIVMILVTMGVSVGLLVGKPLREMHKAVKVGDTSAIQPLMDDETEIGEQARLIENWLLLRNELMNSNEWLEREVRERTREMNEAYTATIQALVTALEYRDQETKGHCERVTEMSETIGRRLGLTEVEIDDLRRGALLHDIGKIAIPDTILLKPGKLTEAERSLMETHAEIGYEMLRDIRFLERALEIPHAHHERWDGTGYPQGLATEEIPLNARIFALVDVWDALSTNRPYRRPWPPEKVRAHIISQGGSHFDPMVVAAFETLPIDAFPTEWTPDQDKVDLEAGQAA